MSYNSINFSMLFAFDIFQVVLQLHLLLHHLISGTKESRKSMEFIVFQRKLHHLCSQMQQNAAFSSHIVV